MTKPVAGRRSPVVFRSVIRGDEFKIALLEEDVDTDPTILLFRNDEEEAAITIHLTPGAPCQERGHITLNEKEVG